MISDVMPMEQRVASMSLAELFSFTGLYDFTLEAKAEEPVEDDDDDLDDDDDFDDEDDNEDEDE